MGLAATNRLAPVPVLVTVRLVTMAMQVFKVGPSCLT